MNVKTSISIDEKLFKGLEEIAEDWHVSRSDIFSQAVTQFLERQRNLKIFKELNKVYANPPSDEDKQFQQEALKHSLKAVDEW
ncbi:hypothetical protein MNBD_UNCLBAC01-1543 [hydrothermal vent metagenome]|uniref:Ribbon-helix-helix protein CopG domain-containing protein n=1 Tax=hydrothermal vent metagenome TaxID=652676 RepID=A0A3B1DDE5_9ZZZZ